MVSSFADAGRVAAALERLDLVATYDLFMHDTARRHADLVLPSTSWLETTGCKSTNTHLYLMPKVLDPPGEARPPAWVLRELARRLEVRDFFPWTEETGALDALLDHPAAGPGPHLWISPPDAAERALSDGDEIRVFNERGEMRARALVTDRIPAGTVWIHDGWTALNTLTSGAPVLPDAAVDLFTFSSG